MFNKWEIAIALARAVAEDCAEGRVDVARAARLARAVVEFQQALLGGTRRPPKALRGPSPAP